MDSEVQMARSLNTPDNLVACEKKPNDLKIFQPYEMYINGLVAENVLGSVELR